MTFALFCHIHSYTGHIGNSGNRRSAVNEGHTEFSQKELLMLNTFLRDAIMQKGAFFSVFRSEKQHGLLSAENLQLLQHSNCILTNKVKLHPTSSSEERLCEYLDVHSANSALGSTQRCISTLTSNALFSAILSNDLQSSRSTAAL